jgi:hypothetical protein
MRGAFGLVGLLVCCGIVIWLWSRPGAHPADTVREGQKAQEQVKEMDPYYAMKSVTLTPQEVNGRIAGIAVTKIDPAGPMAKLYGLKQGDVILAAGPLELNEADGDKLVFDAYQKKGPLTVKRGDEKIILQAGSQGTSSGQGAGTPQDNRSALDKQLDGIRKPQQIPTH